MKKFLISVLAALPLVSFAQQKEEKVTIKVTCYDVDTLRKGLSEYAETPLVIGRNDAVKLTYIMFTNDKTQTWTIVGFDNDTKTGCILATGAGFAIKAKNI